MRPFRFLPKVLRVLLIINAVIFGLAFIGGNIFGLHLNLPGLGYGSISEYIAYFGAFWPFAPEQAWRFVTYMFVHVDFWGMYFFCGIFAAIFSMVMFWIGMTNSPIIGASGALMGIFVAYYKFFPNRMLLMFFFFPMRIKYAMWFMVAVDVFMAHSGDGVAHLAHLGGVVGGFLYMHFYERGFGNIGKAFEKMRGPKFTVHPGGRSESESRTESKSDSDAIEGEVFSNEESFRYGRSPC